MEPSLEENANAMCTRSVEVGEVGGIGFVDVVVAFPRRGAGRRYRGQEKRGGCACGRYAWVREVQMSVDTIEDTELCEDVSFRSRDRGMHGELELTFQTKGSDLRFRSNQATIAILEYFPGPVKVSRIILRKFAREAPAPATRTRTNPMDLSGKRAADAIVIVL